MAAFASARLSTGASTGLSTGSAELVLSGVEVSHAGNVRIRRRLQHDILATLVGRTPGQCFVAAIVVGKRKQPQRIVVVCTAENAGDAVLSIL